MTKRGEIGGERKQKGRKIAPPFSRALQEKTRNARAFCKSEHV